MVSSRKWIWELIEGCEEIGRDCAPNDKNPHDSWKINYKKNNPKHRFYSTKTTLMSLTLLQITVIKSSSLPEHTAQHVSLFSKTCWTHSCLPNPGARAVQHMDRMTKQPRNTHNTLHHRLICMCKCCKATTHNNLRAANETKHVLLPFLALPFKSFSPHFQQIRSQ